MKASTFLFGLTTGLLGSAAAVLLTTPQSGKELRSIIKAGKNNIDEQVKDLNHHVTNIKNSINDIKGEVKEAIPAFLEDTKSSVTTWQEETAPIQQHLQQEISALQSSVEEIQQQITDFQNRKTKKETNN